MHFVAEVKGDSDLTGGESDSGRTVLNHRPFTPAAGLSV